jgi:hypothetical protein
LSEDLLSHYFTDKNFGNISIGYLNQEIVKLSFWELQYCENYLCVDSDAEFIKDFYFNDFMYDSNTPYSILIEDNELKVEPEYYFNHWLGRERSLSKIKQELGINEQTKFLTSHGLSILSSRVLESFRNNFLMKKGIQYKDLLIISPYEFSWYNFWLQLKKPIDIIIREPLFKTFHHKNQHLEYVLRKVSLNDIKRGYLGIVVNSNYSRFMGVVSFEEENFKIISNYFKFNDIIKALFFKITQKIKIKYNALQRNY